MHGWKKRDFVAVLQNVVNALVIDADGDQGGAFHGFELGEFRVQEFDEIADGCAVRQFFEMFGRAGEIAEIGMKEDANFHWAE